MKDSKLTTICIGNKFQEGVIKSILSAEKIILDNNKTLRFEDLTPIEFSEYLLKEYGYSEDNIINNHAKILVLKNDILKYGETFEPGIYLSDLKGNIISHRIKYLHQFENLESMFFNYYSPFD
jgi:hypothetical protein